MDKIDRQAESLERMLAGDCQRGYRWVKQKGRLDPVCIRCGATLKIKQKATDKEPTP